MLNWIVRNRTVFCINIDLALNNLQRVICNKTQTNKQTNKSAKIAEYILLQELLALIVSH